MFEKLYQNIGKKIKLLAAISFLVEAVGCFIGGIVISNEMRHGEWLGILVMFVGPLVCFVMSWILYSWGEAVDKLQEIARNTSGNVPEQSYSGNKAKLEELYKKGFITEDEYEKAASNPNIEQEDKVKQLQNLLAQGLITQEEYDSALAQQSAQ